MIARETIFNKDHFDKIMEDFNKSIKEYRFQPLWNPHNEPAIHTVALFVYGSLRKGLQNNHKLETAEYQGSWKTVNKYYMIGMKSGAYPYVTTDQLDESLLPTIIVGDLYSVSSDLLQSLDEMEGHPTQYKRIEIEITNDANEHKTVYMYILQNAELKEGIRTAFAQRFIAVNGGDWLEHMTRQQN